MMRTEPLESRVLFSQSFTVSNGNDTGPGSFRQAIIDANNNSASASTITFNIARVGRLERHLA